MLPGDSVFDNAIESNDFYFEKDLLTQVLVFPKQKVMLSIPKTNISNLTEFYYAISTKLHEYYLRNDNFMKLIQAQYILREPDSLKICLVFDQSNCLVDQSGWFFPGVSSLLSNYVNAKNLNFQEPNRIENIFKHTQDSDEVLSQLEIMKSKKRSKI